MTETVQLQTTPLDPRFPNTNQAQHCWTRYNEFVLCLKKNNGEEEPCQRARWLAKNMCPNEWIEKWDEERTEGNFAGLKF